MTEKQQLIFIKIIKDQLKAALEYADSQMPDDCIRNMEKHYKGKLAFSGLDFKKENWEMKPTGSPVAFDKLIKVLDDLDVVIEILK